MLLSGEPGIGKSRLTAALLERLASEPHTRLRYFCSPQHTDSAFYPIISQMERAAGLAHDDTPSEARQARCRARADFYPYPEDAALFAEMLSRPNDGRYPVLDLTPEQRRQRTLEALTCTNRGTGTAATGADDLRGCPLADPTSLEVFGRTVDQITNASRCCWIVTFRPEFEAPWIGRSHVTTLTLNRLGEREIGRHHRRALSATNFFPRIFGGDHRAHRWHPAVRRGDDEGGAGGGERG